MGMADGGLSTTGTCLQQLSHTHRHTHTASHRALACATGHARAQSSLSRVKAFISALSAARMCIWRPPDKGPRSLHNGAIAIAIAIACETELPDKGPSPPFPLSEGPYPPSTGRAAGLHDGQLTCIFGLSRSTCSVAARPRSRPAAARRPGGNARSEAGRAQGERRERGAESREQGRSG